MQFIEKMDEMSIPTPMEPKWIRADELWNKISGSAFFSTEEKLKIRLAIETEPGEDVKPIVHA